MPRFFFTTADGFRKQDAKGIELADLSAARKAAVQFSSEALRADTETDWDGRDFRVDVIDEQGQSVLIVITMAIDASAVLPKSRVAPA